MKGINYPDHTGFLFDRDDNINVMMMEIHYDNPDLLEGEHTPKYCCLEPSIAKINMNKVYNIFPLWGA